MSIVVDIADMAASPATNVDSLVTFSLGSCIAVAIWDPETRVGGLLHYMLPAASIAPERAAECPAMFADTGVPLLFKRVLELGAERARLLVKVAGGAQLLEAGVGFNVGKRNYLALRKIFWKNGVELHGEDVGGAASRNVRLELATGRTIVSIRGQETEL